MEWEWDEEMRERKGRVRENRGRKWDEEMREGKGRKGKIGVGHGMRKCGKGKGGKNGTERTGYREKGTERDGIRKGMES